MKELSTNEFNEAIKNGKAIVDFYGVGCINCRLLEPVLTELEKEYPDINFYKVNVDEAPELVKKYGLASLPTMLFVNHGQVLQPFVGFKPKNVIKRAIEDLLN